MNIKQLKTNPNNPRLIKDDKFRKLCKSISDFPKMMELRPIIVDADFIVLGGNMRLKALQELGFKEIPDNWVKQADKLTEDEKKQFIVKDNVGFGDWDFDDLTNNWNSNDLVNWGLDLPEKKETKEIKEEELKPIIRQWFLIGIQTQSLYEIEDLLNKIKNNPNIIIHQSGN